MPKTAVLTADAKAAKRKAFRKHLKRYWVLYAMLVLPVAYYIVFKYVPMVGNVLAFRRYRPGKGPFGTEWTLRYFDRFLRDPMFWRALRNTLVLSIGNILINFPIPILFAILLNEVRAKKFKKFVQTVSYMPRFISTVVVIAILNEILSPSSGIMNQIITALGGKSIFFLGDNHYFKPTLIVTDIWKNFGYGAIVYLAAILGIDTDLYEAAQIDGANRWKQVWHVTLPGMRMIIVLMMVLSLGNVLNAGFDQIFNLYSKAVYESGDILDTFVYRLGLIDAQYGPATAVGLFKSIISTMFISVSYWLAYRFADYRIF